MKLIGILLSPYTRRVAVSLNVLQLPFDHEDVFVFGEPDVIRRHNPLVRIPILVFDDGADLVESGAILDAIDHMVTPEKRLTPIDVSLRRRVLQIAAMALGATDKAVWAFYEDRVRPAEKVHIPWIDHNDRQVLGGFAYLNDAAAGTNGEGWIAGTPDISQADITTVIAFTFANLARPSLALRDRFPHLSRLADRCEASSPFVNAPLPAATRLQSVLSQPFVS